jgi:hypothetical protein
MRIATLLFCYSAQTALQSRRRPPVCRSVRTNALVYVGKVNFYSAGKQMLPPVRLLGPSASVRAQRLAHIHACKA